MSMTRRALREPLLHFLLIGGALFLLFGWRGGPSAPVGQPGPAPRQIVVTRGDVERLESLFAKTWQRPPSDEERRSLIEDLVRDEVYFREAIAIGLDRDDAVMRRRLRQKMEFLYEDVSALAEPTEADLRAFLESHREKYLSDPQVSFRQVYVDSTRRGPGAEPEARRLLALLAAGADPDSAGDRTMLEADVPLAPLSDIRKRFGDGFAQSLLALAPGSWVGPLSSGYGLHLVYVRERRDPAMPDWSQAREAVKRDWTIERQRELKDAAYAKLRQRYSVTVESPVMAAAASAAMAGSPKALAR